MEEAWVSGLRIPATGMGQKRSPTRSPGTPLLSTFTPKLAKLGGSRQFLSTSTASTPTASTPTGTVRRTFTTPTSEMLEKMARSDNPPASRMTTGSSSPAYTTTGNAHMNSPRAPAPPVAMPPKVVVVRQLFTAASSPSLMPCSPLADELSVDMLLLRATTGTRAEMPLQPRLQQGVSACNATSCSDSTSTSAADDFISDFGSPYSQVDPRSDERAFAVLPTLVSVNLPKDSVCMSAYAVSPVDNGIDDEERNVAMTRIRRANRDVVDRMDALMQQLTSNGLQEDLGEDSDDSDEDEQPKNGGGVCALLSKFGRLAPVAQQDATMVAL
eukprot:CAMPEP_0204173472 /NCGR_PEP_ID=MMETSP0361-20130328/45015_1 /ASSEMBLY_ACC=CAM_ASM_000343 /TAXON_ID=268821 /ORGANISM="Scrippsiella Hangoei, Strain SHTV-5" /LENGTH=327 /DNA_ID=CAMNT_0051131773 /DNA_START=58 /DNA_END=1041 /DNA_ORIENTATION=+